MQAEAVPDADNFYIRITNEYKLHMLKKMKNKVIVVVEGRHGIHTVMRTNGRWSCTCPAFIYRRTPECSHIKIAKMLIANAEIRKHMQNLNTTTGSDSP
ncbi:MAG: hypothetical protein DRQ10_06860 [Candidatus Hydrothermota bacterium]|nr:MAG: hypothetical protein DRQ10_06860 [Candidatus Hydrothermae bacterium]